MPSSSLVEVGVEFEVGVEVGFLMQFRFEFSCCLYFHGWVGRWSGGWVVGRLEGNS